MEKAKRNSWKLLFVFLMAASFVSCDSNRVYEENFSVENNVWNMEDVKIFSFEINDTLSPLDLFINLRTTTDYPYSNLYIFLYSEYPNGYTDKDTLEFILAEPNGKWLGESTGTVIENQILISSGGRFPNKGKYTFKVQHAMREPDLAEVIDIGFRVAFTEAK